MKNSIFIYIQTINVRAKGLSYANMSDKMINNL